MACDNDRFDEFCKPRFDAIDETLKKLKSAICGDDEKQGIAERVRGLEKWQKAIMAIVGALAVFALGLVGDWFKNLFIK
jgi:hypothetical protein